MRSLAIKLFVMALVLFTAGSAFAAPSTYNVTVDTSSLSATSGYLYFEFARDPNDSLTTATAQILNFTSDGTLGAKTTTGTISGTNVSGTLPGAVTFKNTSQINDYNQAITFGNTISFQLVLTQNVVDPNYTNTFSMWLAQDALGATPLQTASGELFEANLYGNNTTGVTVVDTAHTSAVPIPAAAWLLGSGLLGLIGAKKKLS